MTKADELMELIDEYGLCMYGYGGANASCLSTRQLTDDANRALQKIKARIEELCNVTIL